MKTSCLRLKLVELNFFASFNADDQRKTYVSDVSKYTFKSSRWTFSIKETIAKANAIIHCDWALTLHVKIPDRIWTKAHSSGNVPKVTTLYNLVKIANKIDMMKMKSVWIFLTFAALLKNRGDMMQREEGVNAFTLLHHDLNICTNSVRFTIGLNQIDLSHVLLLTTYICTHTWVQRSWFVIL